MFQCLNIEVSDDRSDPKSSNRQKKTRSWLVITGAPNFKQPTRCLDSFLRAGGLTPQPLLLLKSAAVKASKYEVLERLLAKIKIYEEENEYFRAKFVLL